MILIIVVIVVNNDNDNKDVNNDKVALSLAAPLIVHYFFCWASHNK